MLVTTRICKGCKRPFECEVREVMKVDHNGRGYIVREVHVPAHRVKPGGRVCRGVGVTK